MKSETSYEATILNQPLAPLPLGRQAGLDEFFARPVYVTSLGIPNGGTTLEFHPLSLYLANAQVAEKMKYFRLLNGVYHVRVELSLTPHYYGWAQLSLCTSKRWYTGTFGYSNALQIPGATLDFSVSNPVELSKRITTPNTGIDLFADPGAFNGSDDACSLLFSTVQALDRDDGDAVGTQLFKVYVWLTEVELTSPSIYSVASGGSNDEISLAIQAMAVSDKISPNPQRYIQNLTTNLANVDVSSTAVQLSERSTRSVPRDDPTDPDDSLSMSYWKSLWGYVGSFDWNSTYAPGSQIAIIPVSPMLCQNQDLDYQFAPSGFLGLPYSKWTGSMRVRLRCSATAFHRGRIMVVYTPNPVSSTAVPFGQVTATGASEILDVAAGFDKVFNIHWSQPSDSMNATPVTLGNPIDTAMNGSLRVMVVDTLHATTNAALLSISVWVAPGDDLRFLTPSHRVSLYQVISSSSSTPMAFDQVLPQPSERVFGSFSNFTPVINRAQGPPVTIRELLRRPAYDFAISPNGGTVVVATGAVISTTWPVFPWVASVANVNPNIVGVGVASSILTPLTLLASCFGGFRGGLHHIMRAIVDQSAAYQTSASVVVVGPSSSRLEPAAPPTYIDFDLTGPNLAPTNFMYQFTSSGSQIFSSTTNPSVVADVEVAPRLGYRYTYMVRNDNESLPEVGFQVLHNPGFSNGYVAAQYAHFTGISPDFQFVSFLGTPALRYVPVVTSGTEFPE